MLTGARQRQLIASLRNVTPGEFNRDDRRQPLRLKNSAELCISRASLSARSARSAASAPFSEKYAFATSKISF